MALTKILDTIEPAVFLNYMKEYTPEKFDLLGSSAIAPLPGEISGQMTAGGRIIDMPFWQDTDRTEPDLLTDDDTVSAVEKKITAARETARKLYWGTARQQADLAGAVATGSVKDPLAQIADFIANYWRAQKQIAAVKVLDGVLADNVANDSADMRYVTYSDVVSGSITSAMRISPAAVTAVRLTMGEMMNDLDTIIMHSKVYGDALNQEAITFVQPSGLPFSIPKFAGMNVVVSDQCTVTAGTNSPKYRAYIVGSGSMYMGEHYPEMAVETYREPRKGRGGGVTSLFTRRHVLIHPKGFRFLSATITAGEASPNFTQLATATNWDRVRQRKNIKLAYLETN